MKKLHAAYQLVRTPTVKLPASLIVLASLLTAFWFVTTSNTTAQTTCQVCHKRTSTLTFPCNNSEYFRHVDHGDAPGPCGGSPIANDERGGGSTIGVSGDSK